MAASPYRTERQASTGNLNTSSTSWHSTQATYDIPDVQYKGFLASSWSPCTGEASIGKFLESLDAPLSYRSLAIRWEQLGRPQLEHLRTPLDLLASTRESHSVDQQRTRDLSDIADAQEARIVELLGSNIDNAREPVRLFVGFASHLDIYCAVDSELSALEHGLHPEEQEFLYWETCYKILGRIEHDRNSCAQGRPHRCLGLLLWGEMYTWPLEEKYRRFEAYKNRSRRAPFSMQTLDTSLRSTSPRLTAPSPPSSTADCFPSSSPITPAWSPAQSSFDAPAEGSCDYMPDSSPDFLQTPFQSASVSDRSALEYFTGAKEVKASQPLPFASSKLPSAPGLEQLDLNLLNAEVESSFLKISNLQSPTVTTPGSRGKRPSSVLMTSYQAPSTSRLESSISNRRWSTVKPYGQWDSSNNTSRYNSPARNEDIVETTLSKLSPTSAWKMKRFKQCDCGSQHDAYAASPESEHIGEHEDERRPSWSEMKSDLEHQRMLADRYESMLGDAVHKLDTAARMLGEETYQTRRYPRSCSDSFISSQPRRQA